MDEILPPPVTIERQYSKLPRAGTLRTVWSFDRVGEPGEERGRRQLYAFGIACLRVRIEFGERCKDKGLGFDDIIGL